MSHRSPTALAAGLLLILLAGCGTAASAPHPAPPKLHTKSFFDPSVANADRYVKFPVGVPSVTAGYRRTSVYVSLPPTVALRPKNTQITLTYQGAHGTFQLMETALPMQIGGSNVTASSVQGHVIQSQSLTQSTGQSIVTLQTRYRGVSYQLTFVGQPGTPATPLATAEAVLLSALP